MFFFFFRTPLQVIVVQLYLERRYTVVSIYLRLTAALNNADLRKLVGQLPRPFLVLGDLNGCHPLWRDISVNLRGNQLFVLIEKLKLEILNTNYFTHFHVQTTSFSCLDLSLNSPDTQANFGWEVANDFYGSAYFPNTLS